MVELLLTASYLLEFYYSTIIALTLTSSVICYQFHLTYKTTKHIHNFLFYMKIYIHRVRAHCVVFRFSAMLCYIAAYLPTPTPSSMRIKTSPLRVQSRRYTIFIYWIYNVPISHIIVNVICITLDNRLFLVSEIHVHNQF